MKRLLLLTSLLFMVCSCDPHLGIGDDGYWQIHNKSDQELIFIFGSDTFSIKANDTLIFTSYHVYPPGSLTFDDITNDFSDPTDLFLEVRNTDGKTLKVWWLNEKEKPGRQFFNQKYWHEESKISHDQIYATWTFILLPEDLDENFEWPES